MSSISFQHYVDGVLTNAAQVKLKDSTNAYGVRNALTGAPIVAPTAPISIQSTGVYSYDLGSLATGSYEAVWEVYYPTLLVTPRYILQSFSIDAPVTLFDGVRLMDIERRVAQRVGPTKIVYAAAGSSESLIKAAKLTSSLNLSGVSDTYILRRGIKQDGTFVPAYNTADRVRQVATYTPNASGGGTAIPDRAYAVAPVEDECLEFVYIDPDVTREAVLAGLERCMFMDTINIVASAVVPEFNLTVLVPWILRKSQVKRIQNVRNNLRLATDIPWSQLVSRQGAVYLEAVRQPFTSTLTVTALRPVNTLVNGQTTLSGPDSDVDVIMVPLMYAAAAGHIELWRIARAELQNAAQIGYQTTQKEAADEFTKQSRRYVVKEPEFVRFNEPFGFRTLEIP